VAIESKPQRRFQQKFTQQQQVLIVSCALGLSLVSTVALLVHVGVSFRHVPDLSSRDVPTIHVCTCIIYYL